MIVVEDHSLVREGTIQLLEKHPDIKVVGEAESAERALLLLDRLGPDVAIVDVSLPGMSGLSLAREATVRFPQVAIVILTAYDDYAYLDEALDIGVAGYLLKTASARELADAVRAAAGGVLVLARELASRVAARPQLGGGDTSVSLTPRQADVIALLAQGYSNKGIAAQLQLGLRTVESHVSTIIAKLGVTSRTEAALWAINHHVTGSSYGPGKGEN